MTSCSTGPAWWWPAAARPGTGSSSARCSAAGWPAWPWARPRTRPRPGSRWAGSAGQRAPVPDLRDPAQVVQHLRLAGDGEPAALVEAPRAVVVRQHPEAERGVPLRRGLADRLGQQPPAHLPAPVGGLDVDGVQLTRGGAGRAGLRWRPQLAGGVPLRTERSEPDHRVTGRARLLRLGNQDARAGPPRQAF